MTRGIARSAITLALVFSTSALFAARTAKGVAPREGTIGGMRYKVTLTPHEGGRDVGGYTITGIRFSDGARVKRVVRRTAQMRFNRFGRPLWLEKHQAWTPGQRSFFG